MKPTANYLRTQIIANIVINLLINALIAFFSFRSRVNVPFSELAVDSLITVLIISFLVSWLAILNVRREIAKGKLEGAGQPASKMDALRLPKNAAARALLLTMVLVLVFGGLLLSGAFYILVPGGMTGMAYFVIKALYAGGCAGLAAALAIFSVFGDRGKLSGSLI